MKKETYERVLLNVTQFGTDDILTSSGEDPNPGTGGGGGISTNSFNPDRYEIPIGF